MSTRTIPEEVRRNPSTGLCQVCEQHVAFLAMLYFGPDSWRTPGRARTIFRARLYVARRACAAGRHEGTDER